MVKNLFSIYSSLLKVSLCALILFLSLPAFAQGKKDKTATDTFTMVNKLIARKKFGKANKVLNRYSKAHPNNLNAQWLQAQVNLFTGNNKRSDKLYQAAMQGNPKNDYLKLDYISSLTDMGKTTQAETMLTKMEDAGSDYSDLNVMRAKLYYYQGDYQKAQEYITKAFQHGGSDAKAQEINELLQLARAPKLSLNTAYLSDNQPLKVLTGSVKLEKTFNKFASLSVTGQGYHFMQQTTSDAPWIKVNNKMFFSKAGMHLSYGAGVMRFPAGNTVSWTGEFNLNQRISQSFNFDLGAERGPYFGTKASVDTAINATRLSASLNFHRNNWAGQIAYMNSIYPDNNSVYSVYGWLLAPVVIFPAGSLQMGISSSYSNANNNKYVPANTLGDILVNSPAPIAGVYDPYFTPINQYINAALVSFHVNASNRVGIYINGDVGYGTIRNPYFYLDKDQAGTVFINQGYSTEIFTPFSASFALNYQVSKTWALSGKYTYRSTYFFNSSYVTLGLDKSFLHRNKEKKGDKKSAFGKRIQYIEEMLASVYRRKNNKDIKQDVLNIKKEITALKNELQNKLNTSEITPGSDKAMVLKDKISSLDDMISDIDAVNLDDMDGARNKREWLVGRQYELSSIRYEGSLDDE